VLKRWAVLTPQIVCAPHDAMNERFDGSLFGPGQPCFGCAPDHPIGFRLLFERDVATDEIVTRMTPGERYQGPPGIMHGGLVATLADELASWACIIIAGKFGFTVSFTARLQQAVRIDKEVEGRARIVKPGARFTDVAVTLVQEANPCFSGEFRFLILDKKGVEKMLGRPLPEDWARFAR
jgi:acyl-coenzyme A thioesterase PaaI-like protein